MTTDNNKSSFGRDALAYVPVKIIPAITGLLSIVILTRNLAPEEYGRYSVVITTALLLVQLAGTWLSNSVLYLFPEYRTAESKTEFRRQTINLQLLVSLPATGIAYFAIYMVTHIPSLALAGSVLVFGQLMQGLMMTFLQSSRKIYTQAITVGFQSIFQLGTLSLLIFFANGKETESVIAVAIGFFSGNIVLVVANRKLHDRTPNERLIISRELFLRLLGYGMPMCLWFFATQFYSIGDRIFLQFFGVNEQLGQYASFRDLATGCAGFLTMPLLMASHPIIMSKWKDKCNPEEIERIISNNVVILGMIFIPLIVMTDIIGHDMITALFGQRYALPKNIMVLIVISIFIGAVTMHVQRGLEVTGNTLLMAKLALVTAIFFALANTILIPIFGVYGGAVIVVLCNTFYLGMVIAKVRKILLPRIPIVFWLKLIVWSLSVEFAVRIFNIASQNHLAGSTIFALNICSIGTATLLLYLTDHRISGLAIIVLNNFRKIK